MTYPKLLILKAVLYIYLKSHKIGENQLNSFRDIQQNPWGNYALPSQAQTKLRKLTG